MLNRLLGRDNAGSAIQHINAAELKAMMDADSNVLVLDVRSPGESQREGRIAQSTLMPLQTLSGTMEDLPADKQIVVVCRSGSRSHIRDGVSSGASVEKAACDIRPALRSIIACATIGAHSEPVSP